MGSPLKWKMEDMIERLVKIQKENEEDKKETVSSEESITITKNATVKKPKTCKICKCKFQPYNSLQIVCSSKCALSHIDSNKRKEHNKKIKAFKENDKKYLLKKAEEIVNKYVRLRDKDKPCISCGYIGDKRQFHAGHYKPKGRNSALRFNEQNIHKQCSICNNHLSGNLVRYREGLIKKIGLLAVSNLECNNETKKWSVEELKAIIKEYKLKIKELDWHNG